MLSKFVGETEKNVRDLFADAEQDQRTHGKGGTCRPIILIDILPVLIPYFVNLLFAGDQSELHVIIFDEIDAICKVGAFRA